MATRETWPRYRREPGTNFLAPGIREVTTREFAGPTRPGIAGVVGARGGAVADASRASDLGMDHLPRDIDAIGKHCKVGSVTAIPVDLIDDRGGRRRRSD